MIEDRQLVYLFAVICTITLHALHSEDMIESLTRMKDFDSLPKVVQSKTPLDFFSELEAKDAHNLCTWKGELYLELHRGTYTSQAKVGLELLIVLPGTNMQTAIPS